MWKRLGWLVGILAVLALWLSWKPSLKQGDGREYVERESASLRQWTIPQDAHAMTIKPTEWSTTGVEASWEFQTRQAWPEYSAGVRERLVSLGFRVEGSAGEFLGTRRLGGDAHFVRIVGAAEGEGVRVRVIFRSCPD